MYGHTIHTRIDNLINEMVYPIEVPEYAMKKPDAILDGDIEPFYVPDRNSKVLTRLTIAHLIDFNHRVIPFAITVNTDIIEIYKYCIAYADELKKYPDVPEAVEYLNRTNHLIRRLDRSIRILSNDYPEAKAIIAKNSLIDMFKPLSPMQNNDTA